MIGISTFQRKVYPDAVTLTQHFMAHGYRAEGIGKIFHTGHGNRDDDVSWTVPWMPQPVVEYLLPASTGGGRLTREEAYFTKQKLNEIDSLPRGAAIDSPAIYSGPLESIQLPKPDRILKTCLQVCPSKKA